MTQVEVIAQQCVYVLSGQVLDAESKKPIAFANVFVEGLDVGGVSDEQGFYSIEGLCKGDFKISCTHVSCNHLEYSISINENTTKDFYLEHGPVALQNITITEKAKALEQTQTANEVSAEELAASQGMGLGSALSKISGVTTLNTGASISKPVIQGLHSNRIVLFNNGVRQEGQQWGAEHAPEIDPFIAEKLTVIKGASGVRYGAEAIGGVVLIEPKPLPTKAGIGGVVNLAGYSNGRMGIASGMLEGRLSERLPLSARIQGTLKRGGNVHAPDYVLANTGVKEYNFSYAMAYDTEGFDAEVFYSQFNSQLGIFAGSHIGNLTDLQNAYEAERPMVEADFSYNIGRPLQNIAHELFKANTSLATGELGKLDLVFSRQFNRREEFDAHRQFGSLDDELNDPQQLFEITTHTADMNWEHKPIRNLRGSTGVQIMRQRNTTDRGGLIPNFTTWSAGLFLIERWKNYPFPLELEAGIRGDYKWLAAEANNTINATTLEFKNVSGTFGAIYHLTKAVQLKYHFGTAWRAPNVSELFSDGVHHGAASYEKGNPDLQSEVAFNNSLGLNWKEQNFRAELNLFLNYIQHYIYLMPREQAKLTIRGAFPAFDYLQANARLAGLDGHFNWAFAKWNPGNNEVQLSWISKFSILRARNVERDEFLSLMPADNFNNGLRIAFHDSGKKEKGFFKMTMVNTLRQTRVPEGGDLLPPPEGYTRFDLEGGTTINRGKLPLEIGFGIHNVFNVSYREYLNRFRYFTDEVGRNFSLRLKMEF